MTTAGVRKAACIVARATRTMIAAPRQAALRARMAFWVVLVTVVARATSLPRAQKIVSSRLRTTPAGGAPDAPAHLGRAIDSVLGLDVFVFRRSCWKRALVLHRFLALSGIESRINFGVQKNDDGTMIGHAWLEHHGRAFLENDARTYVVTFSLPR